MLIGTAIAGAVAYLFLTETGAKVREELTGHINRITDAISGKEAEPEEKPADDYLHHDKPKRPKSDVSSLKEHAEAIAHPVHKDSNEGA